jgi:hypothetical protein
MQDLGQIRVHPSAFACGQDDQGGAHMAFLFNFMFNPFYLLRGAVQAISASNKVAGCNITWRNYAEGDENANGDF